MCRQLRQYCPVAVWTLYDLGAISFVTVPVVLRSGIHTVSPGSRGSRVFALCLQLKFFCCLFLISRFMVSVDVKLQACQKISELLTSPCYS